MEEKWLPIPGFISYAVSNRGRVYNANTKTYSSLSESTGGSVKVNLQGGRQYHTRSVKKLVAEAFLPPHPEPHFDTAMLLDGDPWNLSVENMVWRPRWYVMQWSKQWALPYEHRSQYLSGRVYNATRGIRYDCILDAGCSDGVLWAHILNAIVYSDPVVAMNYIYEWADPEEVIR